MGSHIRMKDLFFFESIASRKKPAQKNTRRLCFAWFFSDVTWGDKKYVNAYGAFENLKDLEN